MTTILQAAAVGLLAVFYIAYLAKMLLLRRRGISGNLLGKGEKPQKELRIEIFLRTVTFGGALIQFASALFPGIVWAFPLHVAFGVAGLALMFAGVIFFIAAMQTMRDNWRAGFSATQNTNLVTQGIYRISRNPAFVGFDLLYIGCALAYPNIVNVLAAVAAVLLFHIQILGEERYCASTFGSEYATYRKQTRRYL